MKEKPKKQDNELERLKTEKETLQQQVHALDTCLVSARVGLWDWDVAADHVVHHLNDFQLLGYDESLQNLSDEAWLAHIYPEGIRTVFTEVQETRDYSCEEFHFEFRVRNKHRETLWIDSKGKVVEWDDQGRPVRMIGSHKDVTLQKEYETRLKNTRSHLEALLKSFGGHSYVATIDYRLETLSEELIREIGFNAQGSCCHEALYGYDHPCPWCSMDQIMRGKNVAREFEHPQKKKWVCCIDTPVYHMDGKIFKKTSVIDRDRVFSTTGTSSKYLVSHLDSEKNKDRLRRKIAAHSTATGFNAIVGVSAPMKEVYELIVKAGQSNASVMIYGESGTGKELVARAIHSCSANIRDRFVTLNCGAIPSNLIESEFFGYARGAFTGADKDKTGYLKAADGGTLFMDEIGEIDLNLQVKLLRVIEGHGFHPIGSKDVERPVIRFITATHRDVFHLVRDGKMRQDFFFRINVFPIELPPLRERKEDIPLLVDHFLKVLNAPERLCPLPAEYMATFMAYDWPGNIRELQNLIHRYIAVGELDLTLMARESSSREDASPAGGGSPEVKNETRLKEIMQAYERRVLIDMLNTHRWKKKKVADILGINRKTLFEKIKKYKIK